MHTMLQIGEWIVRPAESEIARGAEVVRLDPRLMRLLQCLADHAGELVSVDTLLAEVWPGVVVTPDSVYQAITSLRRALGDAARNPAYVATVPRRGYRLVAAVGSVPALETPPVPTQTIVPRGRAAGFVAALTMMLLMTAALLALAAWRLVGPAAAPAAQSIAVMPFLDLTDGMREEPFADGMVEELIGRLSKQPALKVAPPASSFFYKGKQIALAEFARALHVQYVLDGSVRKSGGTLRVAARLTRADDGFVVWSETYDRNWSDKLMIQHDIAEQTARALAGALR